MSDERLRELINVQAHFGLPSPALVEKDFYVVKALAVIAADTTPLRLVFGGCTGLGRAHRLVRVCRKTSICGSSVITSLAGEPCAGCAMQ